MSARRPLDIQLSTDIQIHQAGSTFTPELHTGLSLSGRRFGKLDEYRGISQLGEEKTYHDEPFIEYSDSNRMDANSTDEESEAEEDLDGETLLDKAKQSLEELKLNEAEQQFLRATSFLQEKAEDNTRALIEAYLGLADVCTRKSRAFRQSPLEWFWLCVHASSLLSEVVDMCSNELHQETDNQSIEWYTAQCQFAEGRSQSLLDVLGRTLFNWFKDDWRLVDPNHISHLIHSKTPLTPRSRYPLTGSSLITSGLRPYQSGFMNHAFSIESLHEPLLKGYGHCPSGNVNWFKRIQSYCHHRLESKNVKEIINEITTNKETEETSQSPSDPKIDTICEESDLDLAKEVVSVKKNDYDDDEIFSEETFDIEVINEKSRTDSIVKEYSLMYELASSDVDTTGWEFFLEKRKDYLVQTVLEIKRDETDEKRETCDEKNSSETTAIIETVSENNSPNNSDLVKKTKKKKPKKERFSPLKENCLKLTIAKSLHLVAQKLIQAESYSEAENLCEEVLQIVEEIQDGTVKLLHFSAVLLQSTGLLCFRQGNRFNGMKNLEKALKIYKDLQDIEHHREVALVLIDLGNAYADDLHDDALYDKVISAICEFFERDASDEEHTGNSTPEKSNDQETPEETEFKKRITEAVSCYTEALKVLENNEESQKRVVAMAMRKLGDCHFVQRQYTEALDWYEKSHKLHRTSGFHGKESMLENAHVLSMLGVSTFMLHVYPRASHVFELALHMVKHAHGLTLYTFLHSLVLSLLGITYYKMKSYHKCVSMCSKAFETFWNLYDEKITELAQQRFWLVCQNLYILGNTYNVLNMHHKAIKFLEIGRAFMKESIVGEKRQHMRILQILGDCYFAQYDYKTALTYYNEALDIGDKVSSSTESEAFERMESSQSSNMTTSTENLDMALHNQLLSRSADAHISMKQYQNAVHYLEQARDIQDVLEDDIKGDLVSTLHQLGQMHSLAGDVDKAIESYKESLEVFREIHNGQLAPEMCITLGNLATMCYVKACICEDIDSELEMILAAEQYFQAALKEELNPSVCVKYANFLYSQANYEDAVMYLEDSIKSRKENEEDNMDNSLFFPRPWSCDIVYGGLERVTLPEPLQEEVDAQEEAIMPTSVLAYYILVLSYKMLGKLRHAEDALISLMGEVYARDIPFLYSVLGYAFMELGLFSEAAEEFHMAWHLDNEYNLALDNYCLCLAVFTYNILERAFATIFIHCKIWNEDHKIAQKVASLQSFYN